MLGLVPDRNKLVKMSFCCLFFFAPKTSCFFYTGNLSVSRSWETETETNKAVVGSARGLKPARMWDAPGVNNHRNRNQPGPYNLWPFIATEVNLGHLLEKHKEHLCLEQSKQATWVSEGGG